jgi:hypothetical protein
MKTKLGKRKCAECKEQFQKERPLQFVCSALCGQRYSARKIREKRAKLERADLKELKKGMLTHKDWLGMLQVKINCIARTIDNEFSCISSRRTTGQWHGGHFFTTQAHPNIRFHLFNIWKQSAQDNTHKSGNITEYLFNLYRLFGNDFVNNELLKLDEKYPVTKLSVPEIKEAIENCKEIIKRQQKGEFIAKTTQERITIRIELNNLIGIYK